MSEGASVFVLDKATDAVVEANYFIEVCKEILNEPRFSDEEQKSSCFFCSAATCLLEHETGLFQINWNVIERSCLLPL